MEEGSCPLWHVCSYASSPRLLPQPELLSLLRANQIHPSALVWTDGMSDWAPLSDFPALLDACGGEGEEMHSPLLAVSSSFDVAASEELQPADSSEWAYSSPPISPREMAPWEISDGVVDPFSPDLEETVDLPCPGERFTDEAKLPATSASDPEPPSLALSPAAPLPSSQQPASPPSHALSTTHSPSSPPVQPTSESRVKFKRLLQELVETERSYLLSIQQLLASYRPALEPLAPNTLAPVFDELQPILFLSEELLGKLEFLLLSSVIQLPSPAKGELQGYWPAAALAAAFAASHLPASEHPLLLYKRYINQYEGVAEALSDIMEVSSLAKRAAQVAASLGSGLRLHDLFIMPVQVRPVALDSEREGGGAT